jgi:hypothetical protein
MSNRKVLVPRDCPDAEVLPEGQYAVLVECGDRVVEVCLHVSVRDAEHCGPGSQRDDPGDPAPSSGGPPDPYMPKPVDIRRNTNPLPGETFTAFTRGYTDLAPWSKQDKFEKQFWLRSTSTAHKSALGCMMGNDHFKSGGGYIGFGISQLEGHGNKAGVDLSPQTADDIYVIDDISKWEVQVTKATKVSAGKVKVEGKTVVSSSQQRWVIVIPWRPDDWGSSMWSYALSRADWSTVSGSAGNWTRTLTVPQPQTGETYFAFVYQGKKGFHQLDANDPPRVVSNAVDFKL